MRICEFLYIEFICKSCGEIVFSDVDLFSDKVDLEEVEVIDVSFLCWV